MIKLKDLLKESAPGFKDRKFGDPLPTLKSVMEKHQRKTAKQEQINEAMDLSTPIKDVRKHLDNFSKEMDKRRGGSFDGDSGEYHDFEGGDNKLYDKRYKKLSNWETKVNATLIRLLKDYEKAWKK